jgi:ribosome-associated translation inhibitor RaiA|tara:strand:+ start:12613 stop:12903 length:291 start_codon:yes stop_codon:yes gene_type:complete
MNKRIELVGFSEIDFGPKEQVEKNVTKNFEKLEQYTKNLRLLRITLKIIHKKEKGELYEVHAILNDNGKIYNSEATERNLLSVVNKVLEKLRSELN